MHLEGGPQAGGPKGGRGRRLSMRRALRSRACRCGTHARARRAQGRGYAARSDQNSENFSALFNLLYKGLLEYFGECLQWLLARGALWEWPVQLPWRELLCPHHVGRLGKRLCGEHVCRPFPGLPTRERESTRARERERREGETKRRRVCVHSARHHVRVVRVVSCAKRSLASRV